MTNDALPGHFMAAAGQCNSQTVIFIGSILQGFHASLVYKYGVNYRPSDCPKILLRASSYLFFFSSTEELAGNWLVTLSWPLGLEAEASSRFMTRIFGLKPGASFIGDQVSDERVAWSLLHTLWRSGLGTYLLSSSLIASSSQESGILLVCISSHCA